MCTASVSYRRATKVRLAGRLRYDRTRIAVRRLCCGSPPQTDRWVGPYYRRFAHHSAGVSAATCAQIRAPIINGVSSRRPSRMSCRHAGKPMSRASSPSATGRCAHDFDVLHDVLQCVNVWRTKYESVKRIGLRQTPNLLIGKASNFTRFTGIRPNLLDNAELGRLVVFTKRESIRYASEACPNEFHNRVQTREDVGSS